MHILIITSISEDEKIYVSRNDYKTMSSITVTKCYRSLSQRGKYDFDFTLTCIELPVRPVFFILPPLGEQACRSSSLHRYE